MRNKMPAEYYRKRRQAQKDGTFVPRPQSQSPIAIQRREEYAQAKYERTLANEALEDAEMLAEVARRGRILTSMMRTPMCMWPAEWMEDL